MEHLWAKPPSEVGERGESLAEHTRRVVESVASILALRPAVAEFAGHPRFREWALLAAAFHDLGKAAGGFQRMIRGGPRWGQRHEVLSVGFLEPFAESLGSEAVGWISAAVLSHHRDAGDIAGRYPPPNLDFADLDIWSDVCGELATEDYAAITAWLAEEMLPALGDASLRLGGTGGQTCPPSLASFIPAQVEAYARLTRTLGARNPEATRLGLALRGVLVMADHAASAHQGELSPSPLGAPPPLLTRAGLSEDALREHQRRARSCAVPALLCAPTGSGKTEAALSWAEAARPRRDPAARLFYVLPYQASMNAMYDRLLGRYDFPREQVALSHSRALQALYAREIAAEEDAAAAAARARNIKDLARLYRCAIRILSPYQLLKAAYRLKGYEALLVDLAGADIIVDEVHAYEPERAGLILSLFGYLARQLDVRFFVMTATLPTLLRRRLEAALPGLEPIRASDDDFTRFRRHRVRVLDGGWGEETILARAITAAQGGQSVLCCCSTVAGAQNLRQILNQRLGRPIELLHGRFNPRDRNRKEQALTGDGLPPVLVATQVVEVSLDISFDTLFTEPAPLDALLQRFGRVNRKPAAGHIADVHVLTRPDDGQGIYDPRLVANTLALLREHDGQVVDEAATSHWLDRIYTPDIAADWDSRFDGAADNFQRGVLNNLAPFQSDDQLEELFYKAFDGVEVLPACLEDDYRTLAAESPLAASDLLVSISHSRLGQYRRQGLVRQWGRGEVQIADVPYNPENGLQSPPRR